MIKNNKILFGYNDIVITTRTFDASSIKFEELGSLDRRHITFKYENDMVTFIEELKKITKDNPSCDFRGYTFDFTNFKQKSLDTVIESFVSFVDIYRLLLAA